jgi:hypothetical protein
LAVAYAKAILQAGGTAKYINSSSASSAERMSIINSDIPDVLIVDDFNAPYVGTYDSAKNLRETVLRMYDNGGRIFITSNFADYSEFLKNLLRSPMGLNEAERTRIIDRIGSAFLPLMAEGESNRQANSWFGNWC